MESVCLLFAVFILLCGIGIAAIPTYFALRNRRRGSLIANLPFSKVQELGQGPAKLMAHLVAREELLTSPMGRRLCVYYHFRVEERRSAGRSSYWANVVNDKCSIAVALEDQTGEADIDLRHAELVLRSRESRSSGMFNDAPEILRNVLETHYGISTKTWLFQWNKAMRYTETILGDDEKVVVVGEVEVERSGVPVLRKGVTPLILSDKDDKQLGSYYFNRELTYWIVAACVVLVAVVAAAVAGYIGISANG